MLRSPSTIGVKVTGVTFVIGVTFVGSTPPPPPRYAYAIDYGIVAMVVEFTSSYLYWFA